MAAEELFDVSIDETELAPIETPRQLYQLAILRRRAGSGD
jgi:acyl carrier protein